MAIHDLKQDDILSEHHAPAKSYSPRTALAGVEVLRLKRFVDDRGWFMEIYRNRATHPGSAELAAFFADVEVAQMNYSVVDLSSTVKGLHYHLRQTDIWFCPPEGKMKIVLWDLRRGSPTADRIQVVIAGGSQDVWVKIPPGVAHGYRPLTECCPLLYIVTRPFDLDEPDEYRVAWDHPRIRTLWEVENA